MEDTDDERPYRSCSTCGNRLAVDERLCVFCGTEQAPRLERPPRVTTSGPIPPSRPTATPLQEARAPRRRTLRAWLRRRSR